MLKIISLRDRFIHTAKTDIKCYKVLERKGNNKSVVHAPYQTHQYVLGEKQSAILKRSFLSGKVDHGIHAFNNLSDAQMLADELVTTMRNRDCFKAMVKELHLEFRYPDFNVDVWNLRVRDHFKYVNKCFNETPKRVYDVFECVVPQGSKYYKGVWESKYPDQLVPNIATDRLTVLRGINDVEEVVVPQEQKAEPTVELTVEQRLQAISSSLASMPASGPTMWTSVTVTTTESK